MPFQTAQTFIYSSVFPKFSLHAFACAGWLAVALDVFQKVKTRLTFQLGSQKKQLSLPSFSLTFGKKYYTVFNSVNLDLNTVSSQQYKSRFKRCLVSNGGTNQLFCKHGEHVTLNEEGKLAPGIRNAFIFKDAIFASSNLSFKYLKSAFKVE